MKIKRLEITGFKSFVERTILDFDEGITSIVGPNGCGKSNIVDAIRWVMGEQSARNLRGRSMEDVIFGGSENRKPLGMAEVSLIMDNNDGIGPGAYRNYAEIQVSRRLYRNGESEYLLNKTPCRLLDITELFMDTGVGNRAYSIIEQGKIGMVVNAKPEERRALIEEAAGVTKFKARKKSALRKIEATHQNLLRLSDIVSEVRRQMNSLKRQAQRAQRFREFREELKGIELQFGLREYQTLVERVEQASLSAEQQNEQVDLMARQVEQAELGLEQARLKHTEREKETTTGQEQVFALTSEIQKIESRLEFGEREVENLDRLQERIVAELENIDERLDAANVEEQGLLQSQAEQARVNASEVERLTEAESRLEELQDQERAMSVQLEVARNDLYHLLSDLSRMNSQQDEAVRRLKSLVDLAERNRQEAVAIKDQNDRLQRQSGNLADNLNSIEAARNELVEKRHQLEQQLIRNRAGFEEVEAELLVKREDLNRQRSRFESLQQLEQNLEGYDRGVKTVLADSHFKTQVSGLIADLIDVPPRYEAALEAVLGKRVQALVPTTTESARAALDFLRSKEGRCTFMLPELTLSEPPQFPDGSCLGELVGAGAAPQALVKRLLAGVYLVPDLALYLGRTLPFGVTLVTEDGSVLNHRGELTGGGRQTLDQGLLHKKREIKDLAKAVDRLDKEVADLNRRREDLRDQIGQTDTALRDAANELHQQELKVIDSQKDLAGLKQEESRLLERLEILSLEEDQLHEEHESLTKSLEETSSVRGASETRKRDQEHLVARLQTESQELRQAADDVGQQVTTLKVTLAGLREREESTRTALDRIGRLREELHSRQVVLGRDRVEAKSKQEKLRTEAAELQVKLKVLFNRRLDEQASLNGLRDLFEESRQDIERRETTLKQLRTRAGELRDELSSRQMQSRELHLERDHLRQAFLEKFRLDLAAEEVVSRFEDTFDEGAGRQRREYLQRRIDEIGEVNLMAIEEFQELEERYTFLTTQQDDLQQSLDGLQAAITKINRTTRKRFREAFDQVNEKFREVFPRLFNGGQAELRLTDESDLLETGIEIVAQPPGKKLQNVTLLSGGEKALTAVAMIFSIFMIKPSPFCLLDEVDAPLDDANIGRFNDMVELMSDTSQFIIITHNKRTMEIADNLYGITMEEPGISKMVSVRMKEVA